MKVLVLGLGNPILSDDGVGLFIARELDGRVPGVDVLTTTMAGLSLVDEIVGYDKLFLIDAMIAKDNRIGEWRKLTKNDGCLHLFSSHGLNFPEIVRLGRDLGYKIPEVSAIYGIGIGDEVCFSENLSLTLHDKAQSLAREIAADISAELIS